MKRRHATTGLMTVLLVVVLAASASQSQSQSQESDTLREHERQPSEHGITHLNVGVKHIVNAVSFCIINDNSLSQQFYFDRQQNTPLAIPAGYSFVVTDVIVSPNCDKEPVSDPNFVTLALVESPTVTRHFLISAFGTDNKHYSFTGGLAFPASDVPRPRNTHSSGGRVEIQLLGYFVAGAATNPVAF